MAVELGGGWKLLIRSKVELEQKTALGTPQPALLPEQRGSVRDGAFFQNKTVLSPCWHLTSAASPLSFLLHNPVCVKHGTWDKKD